MAGMRKYLWLLFIGLLAFCLSQCSKLKDELPTRPKDDDTGLHETGWLDTLSTNFHGKYLRAHGWDLASCQKCHGTDYNGGSSGSSCLKSGCHTGSPESCTTCHGGALNQTGAPPKDIDNHYQTKFKGVGAHTAHVADPHWGRAYDCTECHYKPKQLNDVQHIDTDLPAEIVWGVFSKLDNLSPIYKDSSCANVYCHGASLSDGALKNPSWTQSEKLSCNACHGLPPGSGAHKKHTEKLQLDCNACHDGYLKNSTVKLELHIDGKRDVQMNASYGGTYANGVCSNVSCHGNKSPNWKSQSEFACTSCHGGADNTTGAPPVDLQGNTSRTARGVGAHTAHVSESDWARAYDCNECHIKPANVGDAGHIDNRRPAEIVWGDLSRTGNLTPNWDGTKCENVYCHGGSLKDGSVKNPQWTRTEALPCNACHGLPPDTGAHDEHDQLDCKICHEGYSKNATVAKAIHIDGKPDVKLDAAVGGSYSNGVCSNVVCHGSGNSPSWGQDVTLGCTSCHGGTDNTTGAPPIDLKGNTTTTARGVGAHTMHVSSSPWANAFDCQECHIKPQQIGDAGHVDLTPPAEIVWGQLSKSDGLAAGWDGNSCTNIYCHGASLKNGKISSARWTQPEAVNCNSCHGLPPKTGAHEEHVEKGFDCNFCHDGFQKNAAVKKEVHINGQRNVQFSSAVGGSYANGVCSNVICHGTSTPNWTEDAELSCVSCHGGLLNTTGAPPFSLKGDTTRAVKGVGAHTVHVMGDCLSDGVACTECHLRPNETDSPGHIGVELLPAEITWGSLAKHGGVEPSWDGVQTCQNVYCHGEFDKGNKDNNPKWVNFEGTQPCGSCHGMPPAAPHPQVNTCSSCHSLVVDASNRIIAKDKHINGTVEFRL